jgi:hypothetical protein
MNRISIAVLLSVIFSTGCEFIKPKETPVAEPIARASESYLYQEDIQGLAPSNITGTDSTELAEKYVNDWIRKQLMISKAESEINVDQADIERKILDYRYALIVHEFEKLYIDSHLNTTVDEEEIEKYYQEKSDNFLLKQNIVKCLFVQIPKTAPSVNQIRRNVRSYPQTNKEDIEEYCYQYAVRSFLDDSLWVNFDEVIVNTPLKDTPNKIQFIRRTEFSETSDDDYIYLLRIMDYKISDEISPLQYIRDDIVNIILNKRKVALKKELENTIYEEAREEKSFEIFRD